MCEQVWLGNTVRPGCGGTLSPPYLTLPYIGFSGLFLPSLLSLRTKLHCSSDNQTSVLSGRGPPVHTTSTARRITRPPSHKPIHDISDFSQILNWTATGLERRKDFVGVAPHLQLYVIFFSTVYTVVGRPVREEVCTRVDWNVWPSSTSCVRSDSFSRLPSRQ